MYMGKVFLPIYNNTLRIPPLEYADNLLEKVPKHITQNKT